MTTRREFLACTTAAAAMGVTASLRGGDVQIRSTKRGCCFSIRNDAWRKSVELLKPHWLYNWGAKKPEALPDSIEFCPMIWGDASEERFAEKLEIIRRDLAAGEVHLVMGFNEPDQPSQSNITVERAIELWPQLMELNAPLVSPGCVHPDGEWMRDFFEIAEQKNLRVDFVAVHSYGGLDAEALLRRLEKVHAEFARPLWITEFAVGDWQANSVAENRHRPEQIAEFMQEALPALEAADYVDRYAWFSALSTNKALGTSALIDANGELTPLGEIYCAQ